MDDTEYNSYDIRQGIQKVDTLELKLMTILMDFGSSIDGHGYDDGDYTQAMCDLLAIINRERN